MDRSSRTPSGVMDGVATLHARHQRGARWAIMIMVVAVAVAATLGVGMLNSHADDSRRSETALARIEGLSHQLIALERHAEARSEVTPQRINQVEEIRRQMLDALVDLRRLDKEGTTSKQVINAFRLYETNITHLYQLFAADSYKQAILWNDRQVHSSYHALLTTLAEASQTYAVQAQRTNMMVNISSSVTMVTAAILISLVFWRFEQMRYTTQILAIEQRALRQSEERFRALVKHASDVIVILQPDGTIRDATPAVERVWGRRLESVRGKRLDVLVHPDDQLHAQHVLAQTLSQPRLNITTELRLSHADGSWRHFEIITNNLLTDPGIQGIVATYHDITERKKFEAQLTQLAFHDSLSKLPNRALFMARLEHALARLERSHHGIAVLFLDLDNFKVVNDSLGHQAGDRLLLLVAERLQASVRPTDTIARLGGDEFTILLEDIGDLSQAIQVAERIHEQLQQPFVIDDQEVFSGASIGIALSTSPDVQPSELLRDADLAMYQAKGNGKGRYAVFDRSLTDQALERLNLETELRRAIERQAFKLYYQPVINLKTNQISEIEALVRWEHPERGIVSPAAFIPLAEETGAILPLGQWVIEEACRQAIVWQHDYPKLPPLIMGVNLSPRQFQDPQLVANIARTLRETGLDPRCLKIEITERIMMQDSESTNATLRELKRLGVKLAIDDFGTGYCSLSYLKRFPVDTLKIDRSFINGLGHNTEDTAIVRAVIEFAKALSLNVTGEGIETAEQLAQLRSLECNRGQGYYFSKPLPGEEIGRLLHHDQPWDFMELRQGFTLV